jgi:hypothetical protein
MTRILTFTAVLASLLIATARAIAEEAGAVAPAFRIVDVVPDFIAYHRACTESDEAARDERWTAMLEAKHPQFFADAIYRRKQGEDRAAYRRDCIRRFWEEITPRIEEIAKRNEGVVAVAEGVIRDFRKALPDSRAATDIYITISFSFRGKAVTVGDHDVIALGLEYFTEPGDLQLRITLAHELFHFHHVQTFDAGGGLYRTLWAEGLATYASAVLVPGQNRSTCLGFPVEKMNRCHELLPLLAADLRKHLGENDHRLKRIYFGAEANDTQVPPEAGYYVGLLIVERVAKGTDLCALAKLEAKEVLALLARELDRLAESGDE